MKLWDLVVWNQKLKKYKKIINFFGIKWKKNIIENFVPLKIIILLI